MNQHVVAETRTIRGAADPCNTKQSYSAQYQPSSGTVWHTDECECCVCGCWFRVTFWHFAFIRVPTIWNVHTADHRVLYLLAGTFSCVASVSINAAMHSCNAAALGGFFIFQRSFCRSCMKAHPSLKPQQVLGLWTVTVIALSEILGAETTNKINAAQNSFNVNLMKHVDT